MTLVTLSSAMAAQSDADLLYATSFEAPFFDLGPLAGQDGWTVSGAASAVVVEEFRDDGGSQVVRLDRSGASATGDTLLSKPLGGAIGSILQVEWDMRVGDAGGSTSAAGPLFGIDVQGAGGSRFAFVGLDAGSGQVVHSMAGASYGVAAGGAFFPLDEWVSFRLVLDISAEAFDLFTFDEYSETVVLQDVGLAGPLGGGAGSITVSLAGLADGSASGTASAEGSAFFDNYIVSTVPEPASVVLFGVAAAAIGRRPRKQSVRITSRWEATRGVSCEP